MRDNYVANKVWRIAGRIVKTSTGSIKGTDRFRVNPLRKRDAWYRTHSHFIGTTVATGSEGKGPVGKALILALRRGELYECTAIEWHEISPTLRIEQAERYRQLNRGRNLRRTGLYIKCTLPITRETKPLCRGLMASTRSPVCKHTSAKLTPARRRFYYRFLVHKNALLIVICSSDNP